MTGEAPAVGTDDGECRRVNKVQCVIPKAAGAACQRTRGTSDVNESERERVTITVAVCAKRNKNTSDAARETAEQRT